MTCPGGCISGGGQPIGTDTDAVRRPACGRSTRLIATSPLRQSHENESIQRLYAEFLGAPLSEKSHSCCTRTTPSAR
jgi:NADP-reducing hydrogenase subunit HndD